MSKLSAKQEQTMLDMRKEELAEHLFYIWRDFIYKDTGKLIPNYHSLDKKRIDKLRDIAKQIVSIK